MRLRNNMPSLPRLRFVKSSWWKICAVAAALQCGTMAVADDELVLHFTFDQDPEAKAIDHSPHGNNGKIVGGEFLDRQEDRRGVMRFDGTEGYISLGDPDSLQFDGDMTFEMWVRQNGPVKQKSAFLFRKDRGPHFFFAIASYHTIMLRYADGKDSAIVPVDRELVNDEWAHIAMVVEYPRCKFYRNGELIHDAYMPLPGISNAMKGPLYLAGYPKRPTPIDVDEIRMYRRALTPEEIQAHAKDQEVASPATHALGVYPHWYNNTLTLHYDAKNLNGAGHQVELSVEGQGDDYQTRQPLKGVSGVVNDTRYAAESVFDLSGVSGQHVTAIAKLINGDGRVVKTTTTKVSLEKPDWVHTRAGYTDEMLTPWTPIEVAKNGDSIAMNVYGRTYQFEGTSLVDQIIAKDKPLLKEPITLEGVVDGKELAWNKGEVELQDASEKSATLTQSRTSNGLQLQGSVVMEYDGFVVFDYEITAEKDLSLDELTLLVPMHRERAQLGYGTRVYPRTPGIPMSEFFRGSIDEDLAFKFTPSVWIGDNERGLTWQAESDEDWHYQNKQEAVEILPSDSVTLLRANLVNVPTALKAGETLRYKFALLATPIKPMERDAWDLRVMRAGPYGNDLHWPDMTTNGQPLFKYLADAGVRHVFYNVNDIWPWPMPVHEQFSKALTRFVDGAQSAGLKVVPYLIHQRFPVVVPEYDVHGHHMAKLPHAVYLPGGPAEVPHPRPGPVTREFGAKIQGSIFFCQKSMAAQDAYIHSLDQRLATFGDNGVFLDGNVHIVACKNMEHGCGYEAADGTITATYPVFAVRDFMRRIYTTVKKYDPNGVVDVHCSFGYNPAGLAYGDLLWTGEQWNHLKLTGAEHVPTALPLDMFRTEFMGYQLGVPADSLSYRLGSTMRMAAVSHLHDVPVRVNQGGNSPITLTTDWEGDPRSNPTGVNKSEEQMYFSLITKLWKVRDEFKANEAERLFYWDNQDYVSIHPETAYTTLLHHPDNGVLAVVSNLDRVAHDVDVKFNLAELGLTDQSLELIDIFTGKTIAMKNGRFTLPLGAEEWTHVWLRPTNR